MSNETQKNACAIGSPKQEGISMTLYAVYGDQLKPVQTTTFVQEAMLERKHLQAMLRQDTSPLGEDLFVLCEEFGNWQDSNDGGWKSPELEWPIIQDWLTENAMKLEKALKGPVQALMI